MRNLPALPLADEPGDSVCQGLPACASDTDLAQVLAKLLVAVDLADTMAEKPGF
jgi:hypothetical protein